MKFILMLAGIALCLLGFRIMHTHFYFGAAFALGGFYLAAVIFYNATMGRMFARQADKLEDAMEERQARFDARNANVAVTVEAQNRARVIATATAQKPYRIPNPSIGFLNYLGVQGQALIERDVQVLGDLFPKNVHVANERIPKCNVLFIYCNLELSGRIAGQQFTLRDVIRVAEALVVVVASEVHHDTLNSKEFSQNLNAGVRWPANIVYTLNRNGEAFGQFFLQLFTLMRSSSSMPMAWVQLVPQGPDSSRQAHLPGTILALEAGHIALGQAYA